MTSAPPFPEAPLLGHTKYEQLRKTSENLQNHFKYSAQFTHNKDYAYRPYGEVTTSLITHQSRHRKVTISLRTDQERTAASLE